MAITVTSDIGAADFVITDEEIAATKVLAQNATHHASWVWNESAVSYLPPSNPPDDGNPYIWDEAREAWVAFS